MSTASPTPICAQGLVRRFRQGGAEIAAIDGVSLTVAAAEVLLVRGPSGSGKSTLLHVLGGIDRPDRGYVELHGRDLAELSQRELATLRRRHLGFLLQFFSLLPTLTAEENVAFPLLLDAVPEARERARDALAQVGLDDRRHHLPREMSGGQQQRVALARAVVAKPSVLLADEPTGNLDSRAAEVIYELLREVSVSGTSVVLVSHDHRAEAFADRILSMEDGRLSPDLPGHPG